METGAGRVPGLIETSAKKRGSKKFYLFPLHPRTERFGMRVVNAVRFIGANGVERVFRIEGDSGVVALDVVIVVPALNFLFRYVYARIGGVVIVGHTAWHWLGERSAALAAVLPGCRWAD